MLKNIEELIYIDKEITQKKLLTTQRKENPQNEPEVLEHLLFQEEHIDHIYNALKKYLEACTKNSIDTFYQEAARGEPLAQLFIGQYKLASKDMTERQAGEKFLLRVANNPATEFAIKAQLILGDYYHNNKKQKQAIAQYRKAANKGKVKAIYKLGEIFYEKDKTKEKGLKYFRQAAYKGSIQAIEKLIQIKDGKVEKWEERLQNLQKAKTEKPFEHLFSKLIRKRV
ncbi:MAG TPA: hypothetical protein VNJ29_03400, partial [Candidatus Nitrosotenuis sp.]|nr:hypothetical protein [Candidatus Nitrosotenuis sp.]